MRRVALLLFVLIIGITTLSACSVLKKSDDELISTRIDAFLEAYNSGDMDAVLECLDSKTRNTFKSAMGLTEAFGSKLTGVGGISISDLFGLSVGVMSDADLLTVEIKRIDIKDESKATVSASLTYKDKIQTYTDEAVFTMIKEDADWYIKDLDNK